MLTLTYAVQMLVDHDTLSGGGLHVPLHRLALSLFESKKNEKSVSPTKTKTSSFPQPPSFLRFSFITTQSPRSPVKHDKQPFFPLPPPPRYSALIAGNALMKKHLQAWINQRF